MSYQPYLIANFSTGVDTRLQPWLIPDDAQEELFDGDVYRGVMTKRNGYEYFAVGLSGGAPYCESRIVNNITSEPATYSSTLVEGDGTPGPYLIQLQNIPIRRGTVTITAGAQSATDDGVGGFVTSPAGGSGTINYTTGAISITFKNNVPMSTQIYVTYDYNPDQPVMGIMNFITKDNEKQLVVADEMVLNLYNPTTNRLDYLGAVSSISGITVAADGEVTTSAAHNLATGDKVFIYGVIGTTEVNNMTFAITVTSGTTFKIGFTTTNDWVSGGTVELVYSGDEFNFFSWVNYADKNGVPRLLFTNNVNQIGYYAPDNTPIVGDYINYPNAAAPYFAMYADDGTTPITKITCLLMVEFKDRLLLLRTTENGVVKPKRIRISGTGVYSDDFTLAATGAGFIDIPDGAWIQGAAFNRDDLIIFTDNSTWVCKYTGNDTTPFVINKIDESRGSAAPFGTITYLNRTSALSPRGLIITDGYRVERQDEEIPDFSFNEINAQNFALCFAGVVDSERDHYLLYPTSNEPRSHRILVTNYDEDNYSVYRYSLSCMGTFITSADIDWNDLLIFPDWESFAATYGDWDSFPFSTGAPISIGGGHHGEIWTINVKETEDNPVKVRNITVYDSQNIQVTTDWNTFNVETGYEEEMGNDTIFLTDIGGMVEVNNKQFVLTSWIDYNNFLLEVPGGTANLTAFTSGGEASRVIPFSSLFKQFNPYVDQDKKVRCGWIYMYVSTEGTTVTRDVLVQNIGNTNPCTVNTFLAHNLQDNDIVTFTNIGGMTILNGKQYSITVIDNVTFSLNGIDATNTAVYVPFTSGGFISVKENAKMEIQIITNDTDHPTRLNVNNPLPYQGTISNLYFEDGVKKWYKVYINQTGRFIQFRLKNVQAGTKIAVHATMPGFAPVGRLI